MDGATGMSELGMDSRLRDGCLSNISHNTIGNSGATLASFTRPSERGKAQRG